jgi:predicted AlkP superfamily phosphohydrolase/phosphomutase
MTNDTAQEKQVVRASETDATDSTVETEHDIKTRGAEIKIQASPQQGAHKNATQEHEIERAREVGAAAEAVEKPGGGGGGRPRRLLLIGLGGATPDLALSAWRNELHTLDLLVERGVWCGLRASQPTAGTPAWLSLLSGLDPGQLGIYGPRRRVNHSYTPPVAVDSRAIRDPRLWDMLGAAGKHVGVVGAPATTPALQLQGHLIGDIPLPDGSPATFPATLAQQVSTWLGEAMLSPGAAGATTPADNADQLIQETYTRAEQRFLLARRLLARDVYDCFVMMDDGIANIQRALWDSFDSTHPRYTPDHPFAGTIGSFYRFVDDQLFELLELVDDDTIVAVVSVGGAQALLGELALNEWLIAQGDLVLQSAPSGPSRLEQCAIDWERTRAWADDAGAIYLNVAGREPLGAIPAEQAEQARRELAERLRALVDKNGAQALDVYRPEVFYAATQGVAPDLIVACAQPGWRTTAIVGRGSVWADSRAAELDAAYELPHGFLVIYDPRNLGGGRRLNEATIYDVVPTLLTLLGQPVPPRLHGQVIAGF